jgi:hypothetical protein
MVDAEIAAHAPSVRDSLPAPASMPQMARLFHDAPTTSTAGERNPV